MSENVIFENSSEVIPSSKSEKPGKLHKKKRFTIYNVFVYSILGFFSLICFFPLVYVLLLSFSTEADWMTSTKSSIFPCTYLKTFSF